MPNSSGFSDILKHHLSCTKQESTAFRAVFPPIVNLSALKNAFSSKARPESIYRRMQCFFAGNLIGRTDVARFVFPIFG
nr:hypothetical protein [uncultured Cardiobacterium sp.]